MVYCILNTAIVHVYTLLRYLNITKVLKITFKAIALPVFYVFYISIFKNVLILLMFFLLMFQYSF